MKIRAAICNLGCRVNEYEAEKMAALLKKEGFVIVPVKERADVYIVNTCTVTNIADRKSRQMLARARKMNPDAVVAACGCYVDIKDEAFFSELGVDLAFKNSDKENAARIITKFIKNAGKRFGDELDSNGGKQNTAGGNLESGDPERFPASDSSDAHEEACGEKFRERAFVKIQDGCNNFCSYCIIPYARGRIRSRTPEDVLAELNDLAGKDYKEVILSGIHIGSYGLDRGEDPGKALFSLLADVNDIPEIKRIRLGSVEPGLMTEEFIRNISGLEKVCPQFHLSLQSGSDSVLKRMNRKYDTAQYYESCCILREYFDDPALTTDIIVGFPGETEEEFAETVEFVKKVSFMKTHIFKYSKREGTVAAKMPDQVSGDVKNERSRVLLDLNEINGERFAGRRIGKDVEILFEEKKNIDGRECWTGHTREYIPFAFPVCGAERVTVASALPGKLAEETELVRRDLTNTIMTFRAAGYKDGYLV